VFTADFALYGKCHECTSSLSICGHSIGGNSAVFETYETSAEEREMGIGRKEIAKQESKKARKQEMKEMKHLH
jgi:hypothetical protein